MALLAKPTPSAKDRLLPLLPLAAQLTPTPSSRPLSKGSRPETPEMPEIAEAEALLAAIEAGAH